MIKRKYCEESCPDQMIASTPICHKISRREPDDNNNNDAGRRGIYAWLMWYTCQHFVPCSNLSVSFWKVCLSKLFAKKKQYQNSRVHAETCWGLPIFYLNRGVQGSFCHILKTHWLPSTYTLKTTILKEFGQVYSQVNHKRIVKHVLCPSHWTCPWTCFEG